MGVTRVAAAERRELVARLMAEREVSGETWRSIAERTGINYATLTGWVWRLGRGASRQPAERVARSAFVELIAKDEPAESSTFELVLRGARSVRVPCDFDAGALTRLVRALESC